MYLVRFSDGRKVIFTLDQVMKINKLSDDEKSLILTITPISSVEHLRDVKLEILLNDNE